MSDLLLDLSSNATARRIIKTTRLPIPTPEKLRRQKGPTPERALEGRRTLFLSSGSTTDIAGRVAGALMRAGAVPLVADQPSADLFGAIGELLGRSPQTVKPSRNVSKPANGAGSTEAAAAAARPDAIVFDATGIECVADLRRAYDALHAFVADLGRCGRIVVIARPVDQAQRMGTAAARGALDGFTRSLAKEIGRNGSTANMLVVEEGAEDSMEASLRFLLSDASAFITAQPLRLNADVGTPTKPVPPTWAQPLAGKVALVTGAARGIGAATAATLASDGAHVVCLDRPQDAEACAKLASSINGSVLLIDITNPDAAATIARAVEQGHGGLDIVVHNAGITRDKTLARMPEHYWDMTIDVNLAAIERLTLKLLEGPLRRDGRIISLSSVAGIAGNMGQTNYAASKAGVIGLTRHLAPKLKDRGITVNAVAPGFIETRMTAAIPFVIREAGRRMSALGQGGLPDDVARAISFLATPGAGAISGSVLRVCGGALIGA